VRKDRVQAVIGSWLHASLILVVGSVSLLAQGKNPVILIPGIAGSELINQKTGERVWVKATRVKSDDLRLPISTDLAANRDNLVPGDIVRHGVKIGPVSIFDIYGGFIKAMELRGGYKEEKWDSPSEDGYHDSLYVYPYDWRLDNVDNARQLVRKIEALRATLKRPELKFDIVAHSMGGIISRYAAMYGDADLPAGPSRINPTWAGAKYFDKIVLMGTPNEGAAPALQALLNGASYRGINLDLPFVQDSSKFTAFTIPSVYQLMPAPGTLRAFDDRLEPLDIDLYDPKTWTKYGWNVIEDKGFPEQFGAAERRVSTLFFMSMLDRAKRLHEALGAADGSQSSVSFFVVGADCATALDGIVVYRDAKAEKWRTLFEPKGFTRADGTRISDKDLKKLMLSPGDGMVTRRSLEAATESQAAKVKSILGGSGGAFICEEHVKLASNSRIQDKIINFLDTKSTAKFGGQ